jgi:hypothetical protein
MDKLLEILKGVAPAVATVAMGPAGGAVVAALADKFGVANEVEAVAQAIAGDPEAAQKLATLDLEQFKAEAADRADARALQVAALQQEDWFARNFIYLFASVWSVFAIVFFMIASFATIPDANQRVVDTVIGVLIGTVLTGFFNFFFGSSKGSKDKTDALVKGIK